MAKKAVKRKTPTKKRSKPIKKRRSAPPTKEELFKHLSLKKIRLLSVQSDLVIKEGRAPEEAQFDLSVTVGEGPDNRILVDGFLTVNGHPKGSSGKDSSSLKIHAHYQCVYDCDVRGEKVKPLGESLAVSGMMTMWPNLRELVQSLTGKMGIPVVTLPIFTPQMLVREKPSDTKKK